MEHGRAALFDLAVWEPALEKYGAVTHLSVALFDVERRIVCGPVPPTPLFSLFEEHGYAPGILAECAERCLAQGEDRPAVVVAPAYGLAVVGTSLVLEGRIVGAAVGGYALVDFTRSPAIERLAREAGVPFRRLWSVARQQPPVPDRRLGLHGELLQVLGDTLLRENHRTRQYEEAAARLQTEMKAKDEFLAVLSHELRTPLQPILGWSRLLKEAGGNPEHRLKAANAIERNALLQIRLVDDLLDMNRLLLDKVPLDVAVHDVTALLRSVTETVTDQAANQRIELVFEGPDELLAVEGDAGRLQQVFSNILSNALKFTPAGGRVRVTVERDDESAVVRIADSGEGIARKFLPHLFDMFSQQEEGTRRRHSGLGIGLALVKRLVELHQGQVEVASEGVGRGTEVTVRLPLLKQPSSTRPLDQAANLGAPFSALTVLVVEDTDDALETMRMMLELFGADVLVARNGREALRVLETSRPDLVLCDLRMPLMDGFEFLHELDRIQGPGHPPVVAVSGLVSEADHRRTEAAGFEGHLDKPFDDAALVTAIRRTLERRTA